MLRAQPDQPILPEEIAKFCELKSLIGIGSTSNVYLAASRTGTPQRQHLACKVVDKTMKDVDPIERELLLRQLQKEIKIMQILSHANIVTYEGQVETNAHIYCFMELLTGGDVFEYLAENGPLSQIKSAYMMYGVVSAIAYMHDLGIVHRDMKAENLLLSNTHSEWLDAKIIDFGFSTILPKMSTTKSFLGTQGYLAPEIQQGRDYSKSVDIWALGVLLHLTLTCRLPFPTDMCILPKTQNCKEVQAKFALRFSEPAFNGSLAVQDLLRNMLHVNESQRYSAIQSLNHEWFIEGAFGRRFSASACSRSSSFCRESKRDLASRGHSVRLHSL